MFEDVLENTKSTDCKCPGKRNSISKRFLALKDFQIKGSFSICCFRTHLTPPLMYQLCRSETFCFTASHNIQASHAPACDKALFSNYKSGSERNLQVLDFPKT